MKIEKQVLKNLKNDDKYSIEFAGVKTVDWSKVEPVTIINTTERLVKEYLIEKIEKLDLSRNEERHMLIPKITWEEFKRSYNIG